jgi:hypothetical protein
VYVVSGSYSQQATIAVMLSGRLWKVFLDPTATPRGARRVANRAEVYGHGQLVEQITSDDDLMGGSFSACEPVTSYPLDPIPYEEQVAQYAQYMEKLIAHPVSGPETPIAIHPDHRLPADGGSTFYWAVVRSVGEVLARMPAD